ncbi:unnamed protein product [Rotaria sordida]|uniref:Uncharacterized protein n=1 Tax=Rotaria sordida TaxID=392033 RepID=A0A815SHY2_9BILA|nr:unnamed protein product [Rotaria sordida]CAF4143861.1 unnamed protein product [Rotaria sordida]
MNIQRVSNRNIVEDLYQELMCSKSFQRHSISGMLLVQLVKCDQISMCEIQRKITEVIDQLTTMNGIIIYKGKQQLDQALFNIRMQLSLVFEKNSQETDDCLIPNIMNFNRKLEYIIDADRYASFILPFMQFKES